MIPSSEQKSAIDDMGRKVCLRTQIQSIVHSGAPHRAGPFYQNTPCNIGKTQNTNGYLRASPRTNKEQPL